MRHFLIKCYHWLINQLVFAGKAGEIDYYEADQTEVPVDGFVIVRTTATFNRETTNREFTYGYRFENRYLMYLSPHTRCMALWARLTLQSPGYRPIIMIEQGRAYTPFCAYDTVPPTLSGRPKLGAMVGV